MTASDMKGRILLLASLTVALLSLGAADPDATPQQAYIVRYAPLAVSEMYRSGVPASITLAQGLLESQAGRSPLAVKGNNHFGIKCKDWKGRTMKHDDDLRNECFRVYDSPEDSFRDHSDFLRYRDRYKFLFDEDATDYEAWAYGLKKAGYATDPAYPAKLIKLIEDYRLYEYDRLPAGGAADAGTATADAVETAGKVRQKDVRTPRVRRRKTGTFTDTEADGTASDRLPASPLRLEESEVYSPGRGEMFRFSLTRKVYTRNGVPFIYSIEGETVASIAQANNLFVREILKFNDMEVAERLAPGTVVYLQAKKNHTVRGLDKYIVDRDGESLRDIAQRFAVRLEALEKINGIDRRSPLREGDTVYLREKEKGV